MGAALTVNTNINNVVNENTVIKENKVVSNANVKCDAKCRVKMDSSDNCNYTIVTKCNINNESKIEDYSKIAETIASKLKNEFEDKGPGWGTLSAQINTTTNNVRNSILTRIINDCNNKTTTDLNQEIVYEIGACKNSTFTAIATANAEASCILKIATEEVVKASTQIANNATVGSALLQKIAQYALYGVVVYTLMYMLYRAMRAYERGKLLDVARDMHDFPSVWFTLLDDKARNSDM